MGGAACPHFGILQAKGGAWRNDREENGMIAETPLLSDLPLTTGAWQIQGAVPIGDMPTAARLEISRMLDAGVYIDPPNTEEEEEEGKT